MSALRCYCGETLRDGMCRHRCPPEAAPANLKAQRRARQANDRRGKDTKLITVTEARAGERRAGVARIRYGSGHLFGAPRK